MSEAPSPRWNQTLPLTSASSPQGGAVDLRRAAAGGSRSKEPDQTCSCHQYQHLPADYNPSENSKPSFSSPCVRFPDVFVKQSADDNVNLFILTMWLMCFHSVNLVLYHYNYFPFIYKPSRISTWTHVHKNVTLLQSRLRAWPGKTAEHCSEIFHRKTEQRGEALTKALIDTAISMKPAGV